MLWGLPSALLLLLGAVPLIVFLHSLRPRGIQLRTTTYFIWERVLKKRPLGTRLGWLVRHNLLLILQILAAVFLVGALADPALLHFGAAPGDVVVVLDLSASMKANGRSERRFEGARREFFSLIDHLATGQRMAVIGAGPQPRVLAPFTADKRKLRDLGRALAPLDAPGKVKEAVRLAHGFLKKGSPDRIVVVSDGAFDGAGDFPWGNRYLKLILIEGRNENVALVGFEARRRPGGSETLEIMAHMRNFTGKPVRAPLSLLLNGSVLARREFEIAANGREVAIFTYDGSAEGLLQARLEVEDDFPTDNRAFLALAGAAPLRVAYVGPGNLFLERLLRFLPRAQLTRVERWEDDLTGHDVVIFDRVRPPPLESGNFILINTVAPNLPIRATGKLERPRVELPLERHPITTGVQLADLFVQEALRLAQGEGVTLARSRGGPLLWAYEKGPLRALVISFDILASDLPVRVAFPLLFHNAIEWMRPGQPEFPGLAARAGEPFALPVQDGEIQVTAPSGKKEVVPAAAQPPSFAETFETGVYEYKGAGRAGRFAVNLFDEAESQIASRVGVTGEGRTEAQAPATDARSGLPLWPYLLGTVLALLAAEALLAFRAGAAWPALAARAAACAVVAGALANPRLLQAARQLDVILAVDFSYSVGREGLEKARQLLQAAARTKNPEARTGVLFFAREPVWEFPPRADLPELADLPAREGREETDIEAALQAALADFGEGRQKKIVLISDANENRGESARSLSLLRAQGVEISAVPITLARGKNEIYVADLSMPQRVDSAQSFEIRVAIESLTAARARLKLLRDGVPEQERELELDPGRNAVSFRQALREQGVHRFEVLLESAEDMLAENNLLQGVVQVTGPPRVLYLSGASQRFFARALQTQGYTVVQASPETHAPALSEIASFDLVVLDNVAAYQLSQAAMDAIEKYVRDLGGGLVVVGGTESYGAGGYYRTP
ncbi:MAG TPA: VWA domain-containing protein, partial [Candidatus Eisenbacteria bacterium]|nr:VWA domain-containing protein [Candidatus Eisenbacteria bacterium]